MFVTLKHICMLDNGLQKIVKITKTLLKEMNLVDIDIQNG